MTLASYSSSLRTNQPPRNPVAPATTTVLSAQNVWREILMLNLNGHYFTLWDAQGEMEIY